MLLNHLLRRARICASGITSLAAAGFIGSAYAESECDLYPIALAQESVQGLVSGQIIPDALNGSGPGNFGWLSWNGSPSAEYLADSLESSLSVADYINPRDAADESVNIGDWIHGSPGAPNSANIRLALDDLIANSTVVTVPVWDLVEGEGATLEYRVLDFVDIRLLSFDLKNQDSITAEFVGFANCDGGNNPPSVDAGADKTGEAGVLINLDGTVSDDGIPNPETVIQWTVLNSPSGSSVGFVDDQSASTQATFSDPGEYTLQLSGNDGEFVVTDAVIVLVSQANGPPEANPGMASGFEDQEIVFTPSGNDPDGDPLTFFVSREPVYGSVRYEEPNFIYTPLADFDQDDSFEYKASDGVLSSEAALVAIDVIPVNDPPVASDDSLTVDEDGSLPVVLDAFDVDSSTLTYQIVSGPAKGMLSGTGSNRTYQPFPGIFGSDEIVFKVSDGELDSDEAVVAITVNPVNSVPPGTESGDPVLIDDHPVEDFTNYGVGDGYLFKDVAYNPASDAFVMAWQGGGFGDLDDSVSFTFAQATGDVVVTAKVEALTNDSSMAEGGLMFRSSTDTDAAFISIGFTDDEKLSLRSRNADGASMQASLIDWLPLPQYARIERIGTSFRALVSDDGDQWRLIDERMAQLPETALTGIFCASDSDAGLTVCEASGLTIAPLDFELFDHSYQIGEVGSLVSFSDVVYGQLADDYRLTGLGGDGMSDSDDAVFAYVAFTGDFQLLARISDFPAGQPFGEAGVMLRNDLTDTSAQSSIYLRKDGGLETRSRLEDGLISSLASVANVAPPVFLRLSRIGSTVTTEYSSDGATWMPGSAETLVIADEVLVGLYVSSLDPSVSVEAVFDTVTLIDANPVDDSTAVSQDIPYAIDISDIGTFSIEFKNSGTTTWTDTDGYKLVWDGLAANPWNVSEVLLPLGTTVLPGENFTFIFDMVAPNVAGDYESRWAVADVSGNVFGEPSVAAIVKVAVDILLLDDDLDGLPDVWEVENFGDLNQDPSGDFDNDGSSNQQEFDLGLSPGNPDTDMDGLSDGDEIAGGEDPLVQDHPDVDLKIFTP